ncbi:hypothetical protein Cdeb_01946 [Caldibacillus debilis GB1]|uniref:Uncharacterized protein n=1 Tax=Caldibacillus debilis GB1 TaxID=1339248 RepID=A0A420VBR3_9BACI|nr:hypothetical protein Cdeb_01946 [Caldibacillus debilis GB1]
MQGRRVFRGITLIREETFRFSRHLSVMTRHCGRVFLHSGSAFRYPSSGISVLPGKFRLFLSPETLSRMDLFRSRLAVFHCLLYRGLYSQRPGLSMLSCFFIFHPARSFPFICRRNSKRAVFRIATIGTAKTRPKTPPASSPIKIDNMMKRGCKSTLFPTT